MPLQNLHCCLPAEPRGLPHVLVTHPYAALPQGRALEICQDHGVAAQVSQYLHCPQLPAAES